MQRPTQQVITASGRGAPQPLDYYVNGYAIAVTMKTPGAIYTLKQCFDSPYLDPAGNPYSNSYAVSGAWINFSDPVMVNASTSQVSNLAFIPAAIRVSAKSGVSAGNPLVFSIRALGMDAA